MRERRPGQKLSSKSGMDPNQSVKCKIVVVGDSQCGKTALLHVFAKDCFPENYVPTVFENYTASFEIDTQRIELSLWDTSVNTDRTFYGKFSGRTELGKLLVQRLSHGPGTFKGLLVRGKLARNYLGFLNSSGLTPERFPIASVKWFCVPASRIFCLCAYCGYGPACAKFCILRAKCKMRLELRGSPYYDNVRPLSYPDSDAVLICFDISRPETLDSVLKKWKGEIQEFCPNTKMLLVGCKSDLRTDLSTLVELSNHRQTPVSYDQGSNMAKQMGAPYIECSAVQSENSVRDIFHVATLACVNKSSKNVKRHKSARAPKRISHMPGRPDLAAVASDLRKDKAKSCTVM
ncbi:RND3 protein, partial [Atractosteus spatula]|nr:RND3 protein [Atractosteus spatula]